MASDSDIHRAVPGVLHDERPTNGDHSTYVRAPGHQDSSSKTPAMILDTARMHASSSVESLEPPQFDKVEDPRAWTHEGEKGDRPSRYPRPWHTTALRLGPLCGILSMVLALASIFASFGILAGSDGVAVAKWSVQPSPLLAVLTAVANLAMRYACIQGVAIAWWIRAARGSSLSKLHWDWRSGTTLIGALTGWKHIGWLGIACIFSTLVTVDGPLLQKSTRVVSTTITDEFAAVNTSIPAEIPRYFGGTWTVAQDLGVTVRHDSAYNDTVPTINGSASNYIYTEGDVDLLPKLMQMYRTEAPLIGVVQGCPNTCKLKLRAPALMSTCELHEIPVNYTKPVSKAAANNVYNMASAPPLDWLAFQISTSLLLDDVETVDLITGWSITDQCVGIYHYSICTLASAIGQYDITVTGDKVVLDDPGHPRILAVANNTQVSHQTISPHGHNSTLALVVHAAYLLWDSFSAYYNIDGQVSALGVNGVLDYNYQTSLHQPCPSFTDPKEDVIAAMNRMMVYTGVLALRENASYFEERMDPGWPVNTTATAAIIGHHNVYRTDYRFFIAAAVVELACILLVAPTYWGWWNLGRPVSFSPLEVAKAFESPLLSDVNSNSRGRDLARTVGDVHVRYGATKQYGLTGPTKLAFANPDFVERPVKKTIFDV